MQYNEAIERRFGIARRTMKGCIYVFATVMVIFTISISIILS